jgi:hypothetical protein
MERTPFKPIQFEIGKGKIIPINRIKFKRPIILDGTPNIFWKESQQMLIERFNEHDITVHIDDGCMGGGGEYLPFLPPGTYGQDKGYIAQFYKNNFADERKGIFRYLVTAHGGGWCHPQDYKHYYDCMTVPSTLAFYKDYLGYGLSPRAQRIGRAVQVIHELGHSCGFMPELTTYGIDNTSSKYGDNPDYPWYDYYSVMNYDYFGKRLFDYSDGSHGENDYDDWGNIDLMFFQVPSQTIEGLGS